MNTNPYESPRNDPGEGGPEEGIVTPSLFMRSLFRMAILGSVAVVVAFFLVGFWEWTAQFTWSSDAWLTAIPSVIVLGSFCSIIWLLIIAGLRMIKSIMKKQSNAESTREQ